MGGPAVGGAPGPALPDLIVLEVGVAEVPQGRREGARGRWHACSGPWCHPWRCGRVCAAGWRGGLYTKVTILYLPIFPMLTLKHGH